MQDPFKNTSTWPLLAHPNAHSKHGKETHLGKRHFLTLVSVGLGAGPRISTKISKKGVFVKHPSKKVVSFWCWCEGQLKPTVRVFFPPRTLNDWPIGTRLPQNLTLTKSCCSSSATIMATDLMGNQVEDTYLYISGMVTIPKQSECNVNSYTKIWYHFVC